MPKAVVEGMVEATEEVAEVITGDTLRVTAIATAITGDMDMVGGVTPTDGVTLTGATITGGVTRIIPTLIPTTILITMKAMEGRPCFQKRYLLRRDRDNSNLLIGTSVRTQRVTIPMLKIAQLVG